MPRPSFGENSRNLADVALVAEVQGLLPPTERHETFQNHRRILGLTNNLLQLLLADSEPENSQQETGYTFPLTSLDNEQLPSSIKKITCGEPVTDVQIVFFSSSGSDSSTSLHFSSTNAMHMTSISSAPSEDNDQTVEVTSFPNHEKSDTTTRYIPRNDLRVTVGNVLLSARDSFFTQDADTERTMSHSASTADLCYVAREAKTITRFDLQDNNSITHICNYLFGQLIEETVDYRYKNGGNGLPNIVKINNGNILYYNYSSETSKEIEVNPSFDDLRDLIQILKQEVEKRQKSINDNLLSFEQLAEDS